MEKHVEMELSKITDNIYIGTNMCCTMHFEKIAEEGFDVDIDMELERRETPHDVKIYLWLPTEDKTAPSIDQLSAGVALIDSMVKNNRKVYVHCENGHGRAPTQVAAYLIFKERMEVVEAIEYIRDRRPEIHLEDIQTMQLEQFREALVKVISGSEIMRKEGFENDRYYHIYNRGVDKREVFMDTYDYVRFIRSMREFNVTEPIGSIYEHDYLLKGKEAGKKLSSQLGTKFPNESLVEFICYCLNPNHYHFILKQLQEDGISKFMHKLGLGYTNYFNHKYQHSGSLFQGPFKAVKIRSMGHLLCLSVYANCNAQIHRIVEDASKYPWCSYPDYLGIREGTICNKNEVLSEFESESDYKKFADVTMLDILEEKKERVEWLEN